MVISNPMQTKAIDCDPRKTDAASRRKALLKRLGR